MTTHQYYGDMRIYMTILVRSYFYFSKDALRPSIAGKYVGMNVLIQTSSLLLSIILCSRLVFNLDLLRYWGSIIGAVVLLSLVLAFLVTHHLHVRLYLSDVYIRSYNLKMVRQRNLVVAVLILTGLTILLFGSLVVFLSMFGG
jgi:hypothetical protein